MGTVCALILAERGARVTLWSNFADQAAELQKERENKRFLPGHRFPDNLVATAQVDQAFDDPQLVVSAVPCQFIRAVWSRLAHLYPAAVPLTCVSKGIEIGTLKLSTQILTDVVGKVPLIALSGPSIAPEVARKLPCTVVAAAEEIGPAEFVQQAMSTDYFRIYTNTDLIGVEIAGATKNVIAIAAGILDGLSLGSNAKAALLTRGLAEISRLGAALGAKSGTFAGLAGTGDLVTTCISPMGRNRSFGEAIGRGKSVEEALGQTESVVEGVATTVSVVELAARLGVEMPITQAVHRVLFEKASAPQVIRELMNRPLKAEEQF